MRSQLAFLFTSLAFLGACSSDTFSPTDAAVEAATDAEGGATTDAGVPDAAAGAVKFRDQTSAVVTNATLITLSRPLTAIEGDLALIVIATNGALATPPAGFKSVWSDLNGGCAPFRTEVFAGTVGTDTQWVLTLANAGDHVAAVAVYQNGTPDKVQLAQGSSYINLLSMKVDALANSPAGAVTVTGAVSTQGLTGAPAGMTERVNFAGGLGRMWDLDLPNGGPVPARTLSSGDATCAAVFQLVLGKR